MLNIDRIKTWWKQRQRDKQLQLDCVPNRQPILRCLARIDYLMDIDFSGISHHDLMFHKTPLACHEFGHYISVIVFLGNCLKERGFLIRGNVGQLNEFVDSSPTSICVFLGNGDYRIAINSFLRANKFLCSELTNCLGKNTTEARHTLMLVQTYISHLEETLVVMHKMAQ